MVTMAAPNLRLTYESVRPCHTSDGVRLLKVAKGLGCSLEIVEWRPTKPRSAFLAGGRAPLLLRRLSDLSDLHVLLLHNGHATTVSVAKACLIMQ